MQDEGSARPSPNSKAIADCCAAIDRLRSALDELPPRSSQARELLEVIRRLALTIDRMAATKQGR